MSMFDIVTSDDVLTGRVATYDEVYAEGLWHRGIHVIIHTPDGHVVMQKRSLSLNYHPGEIEVSVGGGVDAGETPLESAVREIHEEIGVAVDPASLVFIDTTKYNHRVGAQLYRVIMYSYRLEIPLGHLTMLANPEETAALFLLSIAQLRRALRLHRVGRLGRVTGTYAYWTHLLDSISPRR